MPVSRAVQFYTLLMGARHDASRPLVFRLGHLPLRRATGKFDALVLVEGFFYVPGWLAGRSRARIGYDPIALRTSPSGKGAIFQPE